MKLQAAKPAFFTVSERAVSRIENSAMRSANFIEIESDPILDADPPAQGSILGFDSDLMMARDGCI